METFGIIVTVVLALFALFVVSPFVAYSKGKKTEYTLIRECEANLPRNQFCILQAVPEERQE